MEKLLACFIQFFEDWVPSSESEAAHLKVLLDGLGELGDEVAVRPNSPPVINKWLPQAVALETTKKCHPLIKSLIFHNHLIDWTVQTPAYISKEFANAFAYTQIFGPTGHKSESSAFASAKVAGGFSLQAPGQFYPPHYHKAAEFYCVLSGESRWQLDHNPPHMQAVGEQIFHDVDVPHAMESLSEPILTVWAWTGDMMSPTVVPSYDWLSVQTDS